MSMHTLKVGTARSAARSTSQVPFLKTSSPCRPSFARLPVRAVAVHRSRHVDKLAPGPAINQPAVESAPATVKSIKQRALELAQSGAKAVAILGVAVALVLGRCDAALAARSAGRAGGFHAPSASRSYSGGGYSGGMRGYSGGYSGGISSYSSPYTSYRAPIIVPGPPMVYGGPGVMVAPGAAAVTVGPSIVDFAIISVFLVIATANAAKAATSMMRSAGSVGDDVAGAGRPTLTRVQVGLVSLARELKHDLDSIAARADTSNSRGLHHLLQEVVLALLRNPRYCIYGAASQQTTSSMSSLESKFNAASMKERSKFEQETLVNVSGAAPRRSSYRPSSSKGSMPDELIVVTMLVATSCAVDVPQKVNSLQDLKQALQALGSVGSEQVLGVELLWTPQAEGDYYTKDEIISDYPHLRQL